MKLSMITISLFVFPIDYPNSHDVIPRKKYFPLYKEFGFFFISSENEPWQFLTETKSNPPSSFKSTLLYFIDIIQMPTGRRLLFFGTPET